MSNLSLSSLDLLYSDVCYRLPDRTYINVRIITLEEYPSFDILHSMLLLTHRALIVDTRESPVFLSDEAPDIQLSKWGYKYNIVNTNSVSDLNAILSEQQKVFVSPYVFLINTLDEFEKLLTSVVNLRFIIGLDSDQPNDNLSIPLERVHYTKTYKI